MRLIPVMQLHGFDMETFSKFSLPAVLFLLTIAFGLWLSRLGKPYNGILFNVHKLIALGAVIFAIVRISKTLNITDSPLLIILLIAVALCVVALFASGALMSMGKLNYALVLTIHRIAPLALVVAVTLIIYFVTGTNP
jgi:hypothetical protein